MSWIIKLVELNKYVYSKKLIVENPAFSRKFSNKRNAENYLKPNAYKDYTIEIFQISDEEVKEKINIPRQFQ